MAVDYSFAREQALENCRVLFGQEVQITIVFQNGYYSAVVLPKGCTIQSMVKSGTTDVLFESGNYTSDTAAIWYMMRISAEKIGSILQKPSPELPHQIDISAIPPMCNITISDNTKTNPEDKVEDDKEVEAVVLQVDTSKEGVEDLAAAKGRIWRVVGYTSSGEPCIEEHEPEASNSKSRFPPCSSTFDSTIDFTPGTSVVSDSDTITTSVYGDHLSGKCVKRLEEANKEIIMLKSDLEEANAQIAGLKGDLEGAKEETKRLEQEVIKADGLCNVQKKQIEEFEIQIGDSKTAMESSSSELASLKASIRAISGVL